MRNYVMLANERWRGKLESRDPVIREEFAETLGNMPFNDASGGLFILLRDKNSFVRSEALKSLGKIGDKRGFKKALLALKDKDEIVKIDAIECLGDIDAKAASKHLVRYLNDRSELVRKFAALVIGESGDKNASHWLVKRLKIERSGLAKAGLLSGLYMLGQHERLAGILKLLNSKRYRVRSYVANALAGIMDNKNKKVIQTHLLKAYENEITVAARSSIKSALWKARGQRKKRTAPKR